MTVEPYDDRLSEYFHQIDAILNKSKHTLIAIGKKAMNATNYDLNSNIAVYPSVADLLKVL